jgi:O-methyltransferase
MQVSKIASYTAKAARCASVYRKYKGGTMVRRNAYIENLVLISRALENSALKDGAFIECGTWKGGMSAGMIEVGGPYRKYFFL